jgi:ketosteroid isomerase-like protein
MKKMRTRLLTSTVIFFLVCAPVTAAKDLSKVQAAIDGASATLTKATLEGDIDTIMSFYTDDSVSMPNYNEGVLEGLAAIREHQERGYASGMKINSLDFETTGLLKSKSLVVESGKWKIDLTVREMPDPVVDHGEYITVWRYGKDGSLKVVREIWNSDLNPWATIATLQSATMPDQDKKELETLRQGAKALAELAESLRSRAYIGLDGDFDETTGGYTVSGFAEGSHAEEAGVLIGDVLVKINGIGLTDRTGSEADLPNRRPGKAARITVLRDGEEKTMTVTLMGATDKIVAEGLGEFLLQNYLE